MHVLACVQAAWHVLCAVHQQQHGLTAVLAFSWVCAEVSTHLKQTRVSAGVQRI
jgi:hypothetical protein